MVTLNANGTVTVLDPSVPGEAARIANVTGTQVQAEQEEITTTDAATISDHITSAFMTVAENNGAGHVVNLVTGTQPYNQHTEIGRTAGHLITLGQGAFEIVHGVTIALGGGAGTVVTSPACATGIGCAIPAATATVSAVGVLEAMHGAGVIGLTIYNMVNDPGPGARGGRTEPTLPDKTIVKQDGVTIEHNFKSGDHPPAHAHVKGQGPNTRIGANGKPLRNNPSLSPAQQKVVRQNKSTIRQKVNKIRRWIKHNTLKNLE